MNNATTPTNGSGGPAALSPPQDPASEALQQAQALLLDTNAAVVGFVRKHPVPCLIGAVAIGYVVGRAAAKRWL